MRDWDLLKRATIRLHELQQAVETTDGLAHLAAIEARNEYEQQYLKVARGESLSADLYAYFDAAGTPPSADEGPSLIMDTDGLPDRG